MLARRFAVCSLMLAGLVACRAEDQSDQEPAPSHARASVDEAEAGNAGENAGPSRSSASDTAQSPNKQSPVESEIRDHEPSQTGFRYIGRWAVEERLCATTAWRFTKSSLHTPAGSVCKFGEVRDVPGGYDIAARCTSEGPPVQDTLKLRFAESAQAMLFESESIASTGLTKCR